MDTPEPPKPIASVAIDLPGDKLNVHEIWMNRVEGEGKINDQRFKYLESLLLEEKQREAKNAEENQLLRDELNRLKRELTSRSPQISEQPPPLFYSDEPMVPHEAFRRPPLQSVTMGEARRTVSHVDRTIPAGTTVRALLVSSIDAPCGVYANSDPQPVKLRILDDGHLPKCVEAQLKGGLVIASAFGDISTERIYMRIERLTKVEATGEFIETEVVGFISGEDGKYGVRGTVVDRSSRLVANAAYSGFFSGLSQFLNTALLAEQSNGCCANPVGWQLLQESSVNGSSNAFDMLADYYIQRAEQVKPVIQVAAGRVVDITFTHRAELGDLYTKDNVKKIRESNREASL